jgi:hypothetical protein
MYEDIDQLFVLRNILKTRLKNSGENLETLMNYYECQMKIL